MINHHSIDFTEMPPQLALCYFDLISLLNARPFEYFDLLVDQTPAEVAMVDFYYIDRFWKPVAMTGRNLLAYSGLKDSSMGRE